jgi:hypothetical protein
MHVTLNTHLLLSGFEQASLMLGDIPSLQHLDCNFILSVASLVDTLAAAAAARSLSGRIMPRMYSKGRQQVKKKFHPPRGLSDQKWATDLEASEYGEDGGCAASPMARMLCIGQVCEAWVRKRVSRICPYTICYIFNFTFKFTLLVFLRFLSAHGPAWPLAWPGLKWRLDLRLRL